MSQYSVRAHQFDQTDIGKKLSVVRGDVEVSGAVIKFVQFQEDEVWVFVELFGQVLRVIYEPTEMMSVHS